MTISDEELDELAKLYDRLRRVTGVLMEAESIRCDGLFARLLSHYRSARNDGIEEAALAAERFAADEKVVTYFKKKRYTTAEVINQVVSHVKAATRFVADDIRALKSPPQSEPGTKP